MKKLILNKFFFIFFFNLSLAYADDRNITSTLSCEGELVYNNYENYQLYKTKKEVFFEDLEINIMDFEGFDKKNLSIYAVKVLESSHWLQREGWYYYFDKAFEVKKTIPTLKVSQDNMIISLINKPVLNDDGFKFNSHTSRLSLKSGVYTGNVKAEYNEFHSEMNWRAKCVGIPAVLKLLNTNKKNYLDYWWAIILIIAITFFIFTQSGKRLKKIRRK